MSILVALCLARAAASPAACAQCHRTETASFAHTGMARALETGKNSAILRTNPTLSAKIGGYSYEIARTGDESIYTVTDGKETVRVPIDWAFGQGAAGQTYVFEREGRWYESRVSYYSALRGLDLTMGADAMAPRNLLEAAGRVAGPAEIGPCFECHATNVVKSPRLVLTGMTEGVQCERCHGASEAHLRRTSPMPKLGTFTTEEMSDFCGQCHRTWSQIAMNGPRGILNVRFQPYRLGNSKCYDVADNRIRCTACHNPHRDLEVSAGAYDVKCLACHSRKALSTKGSSHICRVGTKDCVTCHMPRLDLPGAHKKFTDHMIRIVKAGELYPD
jgi:hypothetical protein